MEQWNQILRKSEEYRDDMVRFLKDIVSIPSYSCQEKEVVERIVQEMQKLGFDEAYSDKLGNAVGRMGNGETVVLFDAHIDVVGIGDPESWDYPPFPAFEKYGKIYGRGSVDEKPAAACMAYAARIMKDLGLLDGITLYCVGSVMEEDCDGLPLTHLFENEGIKPDFVVLGEPTDLHVYRGHRGRMEIIIRTRGKSAHGAHEHLGDNAVYKMAPIIEGIKQLNHRLKDDPFLGKGTITISQITSTSPSLCSVADSCEVYLDRRMTVGETKESVIAELKEITGDNAEIIIPQYDATSWKGYEVNQEKVYPTWILPEDHILVQAAKEAADLAIIPAKPIGRWSFSTNGVSSMGHFGIPSIGFAPGREELSHSTEEHVKISDLVFATQFYAAFPHILKKHMNK